MKMHKDKFLPFIPVDLFVRGKDLSHLYKQLLNVKWLPQIPIHSM